MSPEGGGGVGGGGRGGGIRFFGGVQSKLSNSLSISKSYLHLSPAGLRICIFPRWHYFSFFECSRFIAVRFISVFRIFWFEAEGCFYSGIDLGCIIGRRLGIPRGRIWFLFLCGILCFV